MTAREELAQRFHVSYEKLATDFGYQTRKESAVPWEQVPENNKALMRATIKEALTPDLWLRYGLESGWLEQGYYYSEKYEESLMWESERTDTHDPSWEWHKSTGDPVYRFTAGAEKER